MSSGYGMFKMVLSRLYSDYLRKSKLGDYEKIIKYFIKNNYESFSIKEFIKVVRRNQLGENKILILRHDIDTDIGTAKLFFRIEKKYNLKSTYYFRQSTIEIPFMQEIEDYGSEASYHYEEIAQFCKDHSIKEPAQVIKLLPNIKNLFSNNFRSLENNLGYKLETLAAHGDFVNRKLKINNNLLLDDKNLRKDIELLIEAYDEELVSNIDIYMTDINNSPRSIIDAINKYKAIYLCIHPRHWYANWIVNTYDNINRLYEGIKYSV